MTWRARLGAVIALGVGSIALDLRDYGLAGWRLPADLFIWSVIVWLTWTRPRT